MQSRQLACNNTDPSFDPNLSYSSYSLLYFQAQFTKLYYQKSLLKKFYDSPGRKAQHLDTSLHCRENRNHFENLHWASAMV